MNHGSTPAGHGYKGADGGASVASDEGGASPADHQSNLRASAAAAAAASASSRAEYLATIQKLVGTEYSRSWFADFVRSQDFIWENTVERVLNDCPEASDCVPVSLQHPPSGAQDIDRPPFLRPELHRGDAAHAPDRRVPILGDRIKDDPRAVIEILARTSGRQPCPGPGYKAAFTVGRHSQSAAQCDQEKTVTSCCVPIFSPGFMSAIRHC